MSVDHVSSPTLYHKFNIRSSVSPSPSSSRTKITPAGFESEESNSPYTGTPKRWKGSYVSSTPSLGQKRKAEMMSPPSPQSFEGQGQSYFRKQKRYCDLVVTSVDKDDLPRYIVIVEVLSHSTSMPSCILKMYEELICVLQFQDMAYGAVFSPDEFVILSAKRRRTVAACSCHMHLMFCLLTMD